MKKLFVVAALSLLPLAPAMADNDIGCGLGTQIWVGQTGLVAKVLGATTNGFLGNQTFGITFGTLGCSPDGVVKAEARKLEFASANLDQLAAEMAAGEGETLETLAKLYNVAADDQAEFVATAKASYAQIFSSEAVTTGDVLAALEVAMTANARLAHYVG